jgi:hypothetical protein
VLRVDYEEVPVGIIVATMSLEGSRAMQAMYDREVDVLTLELADGTIDHTEETDGMIVHLPRTTARSWWRCSA